MKCIKNKHLYIYYLLVQTLHLVMLITIFVGGFEKYLPYLSTDLLPSQILLLGISGFIDLFFSTPLGIIGSILALRSEKKRKVLAISVIFLWASALIYELALLINYPTHIFSVNLVFHILFLPVVLLSYRIVKKIINHR
jgi:hypothetical protein